MNEHTSGIVADEDDKQKIDSPVSDTDNVVPQGKDTVEPPAMQQERLQHIQEESVESSHTPAEANISPFGVAPWGKTVLLKKFIKIMRRKTTKCHRPILDVLVVGLESALCNSAI